MKILIIDDTFGYRRLLRRVLEAELDLALVFEASDGEEGLRLAQQFKPNIVLLNMDVLSSETKGLETARRIKDSSGGASVLVLSALGTEAYRQRAAEYGADAYLPRGASIFEILVAIRRMQPPKAA